MLFALSVNSIYLYLHLRPLHTESEIFACVFPFFHILHPFLSKLHATDAKNTEIEKFRRQCANVIDTTWGRIYFLTCENFGRKCRTQCAETFSANSRCLIINPSILAVQLNELSWPQIDNINQLSDLCSCFVVFFSPVAPSRLISHLVQVCTVNYPCLVLYLMLSVPCFLCLVLTSFCVSCLPYVPCFIVH